MTHENPYEVKDLQQEATTTTAAETKGAKAAYNIVTDVVTGVNVRKSDNWFQAKCIGVSMLPCSGVGSVVAGIYDGSGFSWIAGALVGAFVGVLIGLFGSGIFLMIFRATAHLKGKHD